MTNEMIVVCVILVLAVIINIVAGKKSAEEMAIMFVLEAERLYGGEVGKTKFRDAVTQVYDKMPVIIRALYPKDYLLLKCEEIVQRAFNRMKSRELGELEDKMKAQELYEMQEIE